MPWKSHAVKEQFKRAVKDAGDRGELGIGYYLEVIYNKKKKGATFSYLPKCAIGHAVYAIRPLPAGIMPSIRKPFHDYYGLTREERSDIETANDDTEEEFRVEAVCEVCDSIPVGNDA